MRANQLRAIQGRRPRIDNVPGLVRFTGGIVQDVLDGQVPVDVGRTALYGVSVLLCLVELSDLEQRSCQPESPTPAVVTDQLRIYMRENFGMPGYATSWYPRIRDVRAQGDMAVADTDLTVRVGDRTVASTICVAVSNFVFPRDRHHGLHRVQVRAATGEPLIFRDGRPVVARRRRSRPVWAERRIAGVLRYASAPYIARQPGPGGSGFRCSR